MITRLKLVLYLLLIILEKLRNLNLRRVMLISIDMTTLAPLKTSLNAIVELIMFQYKRDQFKISKKDMF